MIAIHYLFENKKFYKPTNEMVKHFTRRTCEHISLVQKYLQKIMDLNDPRLDNIILKQEMTHDQSKFQEPEMGPYLWVNWSYHQKDLNKKFDPPQEIKSQMQAATFHHVKTNLHHAEAWDKNATEESINPKDRYKVPDKMVDATNMPLTYVASMVADWLAMSEEKKTCPYEWAEKNINRRWKFSDEQVKLIYDLLDKIWVQKIDYKGWIVSIQKYDHGWSGNAKKDKETLSIRGWCSTKEEAIKEFKNMVDNWIKNNS